MHGSADMAGTSAGRSRRTFFCLEIARQDQPLEMKFESTPDVSHLEMRAVRGPFLSVRFGRIFSLAFLSSSSVAAFDALNSDSGNGMFFATWQEASEIIAPEASRSHATFRNICRDSPSEGDRCMKDTHHPMRHLPRHHRIFAKVRSRRSCACHDHQFGHGRNTGLGWSDPTFVHVSVPKVIRGVAPAQLRGDRAECFVRAAFRSRGPQ
jgi:hypothetical protein